MKKTAIERFDSFITLSTNTLKTDSLKEHLADKVRKAYRTQHCICLRKFLNESLLEEIAAELPSIFMESRRNKGGDYILECNEEPRFGARLRFILNDARIFRMVEHLTGGALPKYFYGRFYRMHPGVHEVPWHRDASDNRILGVSINLTRKKSSGGKFQIRPQENRDSIFELKTSHWGDAHFFDVSRPFEHRVTDVKGRISRDAFSGWFSA